MSTTYVPADLRRTVIQRADRLCEYCLIHRDDTYFGCEVDHIISEKHGGGTDADNLAYACLACNRAKGSDLGSLATGSSQLVRFFDPRRDLWSDHFGFGSDLELVPRTEIGEVTVRIFGFNAPERLIERRVLHEESRYPTPEALKRIEGEAKPSHPSAR